MSEGIEKLALTMMLRTLPTPPYLLNVEQVSSIVESARDFVKGKIWIRYDPVLEGIVCGIYEEKEE